MRAFKDVEIGEVFFDPTSGDYWKKISAMEAEHMEGESGTDIFDPEEVVELD